MFDTIIAPLDTSLNAELALPYAIDEAKRHGATLVLLHVIPQPELCTSTVRRSGPLPPSECRSATELAREERAARDYLQSIVERFGLDPETPLRVVSGSPGPRIKMEARQYPQPLIVLMSGHPVPNGEVSRSEVVDYLLTTDSVPILGVKPLGHPEDNAAGGTKMPWPVSELDEQETGNAHLG